MKDTLIALFIVLLIYSCSSKNNRNKEVSTYDNMNGWNYEIDDSQVGLISTKNLISDISSLLPSNYIIEKDSLENAEGCYELSYFIKEGNDYIFEITPNKEDKNRIYSIKIFSSEYIIKNTNIRVSDSYTKLIQKYTLKDTYFNINDGLYIYCENFNGAFEIELNEKGDTYESIDSLNKSNNIKSIIIY